MGAGELKAAVDAGPLIHLAEIGCLRLLNGFDVLHMFLTQFGLKQSRKAAFPKPIWPTLRTFNGTQSLNQKSNNLQKKTTSLNSTPVSRNAFLFA